MFRYYVELGWHNLRRNVVLTPLMISAIAFGIGASMTILTVFRAMAADPIPDRSSHLFVPQLDNWGPDKQRADTPDHLPDQLAYTDARALLDAHVGRRQTATYVSGQVLAPSNPQLLPVQARVRAATADFFTMFETPFKYGSGWSKADDDARSAVAVITRELNDRLFGGTNSVGRTIHLGDDDYRVVGVLSDWKPIPRFYDLSNERYGKIEDVLLPFARAIERELPLTGNEDCRSDVPTGWEGHLRSDCVWIQFWAELPTQSDVANYRAYLRGYAAEQQRGGRFHWTPATQLRDAREWLQYEHVVPDEVRVMAIVAFTFLLVCVVNAAGLMLAKVMGRATDIGIRRALGASRRAIFSQLIVEAAVVGFAGGLVGLLLTWVGLMAIRTLFSHEVVELTHLDITDTGIAIGVATLATTAAGLYPTWRATRIPMAWHLKN